MLQRIVINKKPHLVFLQETKLRSFEIERVRAKLHYIGMIVVDCEGEGSRRRGGLALLWNDEWDVSITSFSNNDIDALICHDNEMKWRFTGLYGHS